MSVARNVICWRRLTELHDLVHVHSFQRTGPKFAMWPPCAVRVVITGAFAEEPPPPDSQYAIGRLVRNCYSFFSTFLYRVAKTKTRCSENCDEGRESLDL